VPLLIKMQYLGLHFTISPKDPGAEILLALLSEKPFDTFEETDQGLSAYIKASDWSKDLLDDVFILESDEFEVTYNIEEIEQVNWNEAWEKNFNPIDVDGICHVRAPFHPKTDAKYDIVIEPKMSFGTGHHETTHMMIQHLLMDDLTDKSALDMGCGTAILAILAEMRGAKPIDAIDIDNWCYENSLENIAKNNCQNISVYEGDASLLTDQKYDVIIANINRNILLNDLPKYKSCLNKKGFIYLSGFYEVDIEVINHLCVSLGLRLERTLEKNQWVSLKYIFFE
jgi:ribosomal protein L11 methyltransferase